MVVFGEGVSEKEKPAIEAALGKVTSEVLKDGLPALNVYRNMGKLICEIGLEEKGSYVATAEGLDAQELATDLRRCLKEHGWLTPVKE